MYALLHILINAVYIRVYKSLIGAWPPRLPLFGEYPILAENNFMIQMPGRE